MKIRNVEDARKNLYQVIADMKANKPIDPATLKAARLAIRRMKRRKTAVR